MEEGWEGQEPWNEPVSKGPGSESLCEHWTFCLAGSSLVQCRNSGKLWESSLASPGPRRGAQHPRDLEHGPHAGGCVSSAPVPLSGALKSILIAPHQVASARFSMLEGDFWALTDFPAPPPISILGLVCSQSPPPQWSVDCWSLFGLRHLTPHLLPCPSC